MKIIIINGYGGSGKDLFVKLFQKNYKYKVFNWSTVDTIKDVSLQYFGWNGEKNDKSRKFISDLKRLWTEFNDGPFNALKNKIIEKQKQLLKNSERNFIFFIHCREPDEIKKFVDFFKLETITLLINRNVHIPNNKSDENVSDFLYDYVIDNNKTEYDLELKAQEFIDYILKK